MKQWNPSTDWLFIFIIFIWVVVCMYGWVRGMMYLLSECNKNKQNTYNNTKQT